MKVNIWDEMEQSHLLFAERQQDMTFLALSHPTNFVTASKHSSM